jgi:DNA polymerase I-like protein with 3'-5' exonuclease and polymerase domains
MGLGEVKNTDETQQADLVVVPDVIKPKFEQIRSIDQLKQLVAKWSKIGLIAVDTETTGMNPMTCELVGMSFAVEETTGWYLPLERAIAAFGPQRSPCYRQTSHRKSAIRIIGQNLK